MLVAKEKVRQVVEELRREKALGVDTETTGLRFWRDSLFAIIISSKDQNYYFNFLDYTQVKEDMRREFGADSQVYQDHQPIDSKFVLGAPDLAILAELFAEPDIVWFAHNAKFDMHMLENEHLVFGGTVHCTEVGARLVYNQYHNYSLDQVAARAGKAKEDGVKAYIHKHKLITKKMVNGKELELLHFDKVPFPLMYSYGLTDGELVYSLGMAQIQELRRYCTETPGGEKPIRGVYHVEKAVTKTLASMERQGVRIDPRYCGEAIAYEEGRAIKAKKEFAELTDMPFVDSRKTYVPAFDKLGLEYGLTAKGNPSFKDELLPDNVLGNCIRTWRNATKNVSTYYGNFLYYRDDNDRIHCNIRQSGTSTGRLSCAEPNLQNLPKREDKNKKYLVRRAFIPCSEDYTFFMIDWDQMEYRLLLDLVGEMGIINQILNDGLDVHDATANAMRVERFHAKTLNFMLLYGGGAAKLAKALSVTLNSAKGMKNKYFSSLPKVSAATERWIQEARAYGKIRNHAGRICYFPDKNKDYVAPNHKIQGGCADIVKLAMPRCHEHILKKKARSKILLQVHDELLFSIHKDEFDLVPELHKIMESAYEYKHLPLTCSIEYSNKSWADKEPWKG